VTEYLNFVSEIKGVKTSDKKAGLDRIMDLVRIGDVKGRLIRNLSKGYRQRVGLAQALIGNPDVLILDEPTVGLDPKQIIEMRNLIKKLGKSHTIILSSHILPEVSEVCERVVIIDHGRIVASDTPANLSKGLGDTSRITLRIAASEKQALKVVGELQGIRSVESQGSMEPDTVDIIVQAEDNVDIRRPLFHAFSRASYPILMMKAVGMTLEDIFMRVTTQDDAVSDKGVR